jgi:excisionase family DNA binding protein
MSSTYSTLEVAQRLGVSVQTVQRWVDMGQLRAWKTLGGHRRIDAASADALFRAHAVSGLDGAAAAAADVAPAAAAVPTPSADTATPDAHRPLRVLVVDDDEADRELVGLLVRKALPSAVIDSASSGFEALMKVGRETPDVLITDVMMPHMNGFEMLSHLRAGERAAPRLLIATSSHSAHELAALGRLPDSVAFVAKPIDRTRFFALLRDHEALERAATT